MISKRQKKNIKSLQQKKYRNGTGLFVAEGWKTVSEFFSAKYNLKKLYYTEKPEHNKLPLELCTQISEAELRSISFLKSPNKVLAVFEIREPTGLSAEGLVLVLDDIRDPGNLGTIIRLCHWFGVHRLICSLNTVDCYNPKVVQASMGSLARVKPVYTDVIAWLKKTHLPVYGGCLKGENIYTSKLSDEAVLVLGNESRGVLPEIENLLKFRLTIPPFKTDLSAESLNVAVAAGIMLSEFRRRIN